MRGRDKMWGDGRGGKVRAKRKNKEGVGDRGGDEVSGDLRGESQDIPEPAVGWRGNSH